MTKYQSDFYNYLLELEKFENEYGKEYLNVAFEELFKYWKQYEKQGIKDSLQLAMKSTESFVGLPVKIHLN